MDITSPKAKLLVDLMSASAQRARVLAHNIANQNVPGYLRQDVVFEELLAKEFERKSPRPASVHAETVTDHDSPVRADGNNVDMEVEHSLSEENAILFDLYATLLKGQMGMLRTAISGHR